MNAFFIQVHANYSRRQAKYAQGRKGKSCSNHLFVLAAFGKALVVQGAKHDDGAHPAIGVSEAQTAEEGGYKMRCIHK